MQRAFRIDFLDTFHATIEHGRLLGGEFPIELRRSALVETRPERERPRFALDVDAFSTAGKHTGANVLAVALHPEKGDRFRSLKRAGFLPVVNADFPRAVEVAFSR